jgi:hypothetical protein
MSETHRPRRLLRSIAAVLAGIIAVFVLSLGTDQVMHALDVYPPWGEPMVGTGLYVLALSYRIVYGIVGGYVTAWLAPHAPVGHALVLGVVGFVLSVGGAVAMWNFGPHWYPIALALTALPCAWFGGVLYRPTVAAG